MTFTCLNMVARRFVLACAGWRFAKRLCNPVRGDGGRNRCDHSPASCSHHAPIMLLSYLIMFCARHGTCVLLVFLALCLHVLYACCVPVHVALPASLCTVAFLYICMCSLDALRSELKGLRASVASQEKVPSLFASGCAFACSRGCICCVFQQMTVCECA